MNRKGITLITMVLVSIGAGFGARLGSDYATYRECMGMFPVLFSFYRDANQSVKGRKTFQQYARGAYRCIEESSWISRKAYRFLNPPYSVDPSTGGLKPQWFEDRGDVDPSEEQLRVLQSLFDDEIPNATPSIEDLRSTVILHDLSVSLRNE